MSISASIFHWVASAAAAQALHTTADSAGVWDLGKGCCGCRMVGPAILCKEIGSQAMQYIAVREKKLLIM